jgi:hypothetical protein
MRGEHEALGIVSIHFVSNALLAADMADDRPRACTGVKQWGGSTRTHASVSANSMSIAQLAAGVGIGGHAPAQGHNQA